MILARRRAPTALVLLLGLIGCVVACEPRIEEPLPPAQPDPAATSAASVRAPSASASATAGAQASPAASASGAPAGRCVRPSPPEPTRKLTMEGKFDPKCPADPEKPPKLKSGKATFTDSKDQAVTIEITDNDHDRQRGLMYRKSMPDDHGMIFVFDRKDDHSFWMKNTCIPLDMLYIDDDGLIVGIEENVPTLNEDTYSVGCESKYVLEMNAGWTRKHGVKAGQRVKLDL